MENQHFTGEKDAFISELQKRGKSLNTLKNYRTDLNTFENFLVEKKNPRLSEISDEVLRDYSRFLDQKYNSPNSVRRRVQALRLFFDWLVEHKKVSENPIKRVLSAKKVVLPPRPPAMKLVKKIYDQLFAQTHGDDLSALVGKRNLVVFYLIYGAGLKVSEIESLKERNLFIDDECARVMVDFDPDREPKTIPLGGNFQGLVKDYLRSLKSFKDNEGHTFSDLLFYSNPYRILGGKFSARGIEVLFKDLSKELSEVVAARDLRQACIVRWIQHQVPESRIKERMGVRPNYSLTPYKSLAKDLNDEVFSEIIFKHVH